MSDPKNHPLAKHLQFLFESDWDCQFCKGKSFSIDYDSFCLAGRRSFGEYGLFNQKIPVIIIQCDKCKSIHLFNATVMRRDLKPMGGEQK